MNNRFFVLVFVLLLGGCLSVNSDIEVAAGETVDRGLNTVNGSVRVGTGSQVNGSAKTVNGSIEIGEGGVVEGSVETVNGKISLQTGARVESVKGVNGRMDIGPEAIVDGDVETVNGQVRIGEGAIVEGQVASVNGQIRLQGGTAGSVENAQGGIVLEAGSRVLGELRVVKPRGSFRDKPVMVEIHADCEVIGPLVFEREVTLRIHETATVGEIRGADPEYFSD